jgi:hypothetical protein
MDMDEDTDTDTDKCTDIDLDPGTLDMEKQKAGCPPLQRGIVPFPELFSV